MLPRYDTAAQTPSLVALVSGLKLETGILTATQLRVLSRKNFRGEGGAPSESLVGPYCLPAGLIFARHNIIMSGDEKSASGSTGSPQQEDGKDGTKDIPSTSSNNQQVPDSSEQEGSPSSTVDMSTIDNIDAETADVNNNNNNSNSHPSPDRPTPTPAQQQQPPQPPGSPNLGANPDEADTLHSLLFNQDGGCLSVGTGRGFRVCNVWPFNETFRREFGANIQLGGGGDDADGSGAVGDADAAAANVGKASTSNTDASSGGGGSGGVGMCSMLYRTNLLALTSTTPPPINSHSRVTHSMHTAHHTAHNAATAGQLTPVTSPSFPPNKVLIYDDALSRPIGELSFRHRVLCVKLRRDRIVVILRDKIYVYRFSDLKLMDCVGTGRNEAGLCAISLEGATGTTGGGGGGVGVNSGGGGSNDGDNAVMVLACPGVVTGQVRLELYGLRKTSVSLLHSGFYTFKCNTFVIYTHLLTAPSFFRHRSAHQCPRIPTGGSTSDQ